MTRFRYFTATSLDGFLADDRHGLHWLMTVPQTPPGERASLGDLDYDTFIGGVGAVALGANTYQWLLEHELTGGAPWPYDMPSFLFTHRSLDPISPQLRIRSGRPREHRAELLEAAGGKNVWVIGGGGLAADFADDGMLDDMVVAIAPVTLGSGMPLFPRPYRLRPAETGRDGEFVCVRYDVLGPYEPPA